MLKREWGVRKNVRLHWIADPAFYTASQSWDLDTFPLFSPLYNNETFSLLMHNSFQSLIQLQSQN